MILLKKITFETSTLFCNTTGILFAFERKAQISKQMNKANTWIVKVFLFLRPCCSLPPWTENADSFCVYPAGTIFYVQCLWITLMWFFFSFSDHAIKSMKAESKLKASLGFAWCMKHTDSHSSLLYENQIRIKSLFFIQIKIYDFNIITWQWVLKDKGEVTPVTGKISHLISLRRRRYFLAIS